MMVSCFLCNKEYLTEADPHAFLFIKGEWRNNCGCYFTTYQDKEAIKHLTKDLDTATTIASEVLVRIGHQGSNEQDRIHNSQYNEIHDIRDKYKLDDV